MSVCPVREHSSLLLLELHFISGQAENTFPETGEGPESSVINFVAAIGLFAEQLRACRKGVLL